VNVDPPLFGETLRPLAVLVIASEPGIRQFVSIILQRDGYAVLEASRGRDGLLQFHQQHPDLVVIDEEFDLSGWQVLAGIRESSNAPVLLLTTPNTNCDRLANLDQSREDYLMKPFARAWLPEKLRTLTAQTRQTP
jgi:DNA-binding response OmpR family regulator